MASFTNLLVRLSMWDIIFTGSSTPIAANNSLDCGRLCYLNTTCSSFVFNQASRACYLQQEWMKNLVKSDTSTGIYYYQVDSGRCSGFEYQSIGNMAMCVKFSTEKKRWENAKIECESEGARLVTLDTEEKNNAVLDILKNDYQNRRFFIGLSDPEQNKQFKWTDGSTLEYTLWTPHEPHNTDYYVCIEWHASVPGWFGKPDFRYRYICEKVLNQ